jgi:hypothetical protein
MPDSAAGFDDAAFNTVGLFHSEIRTMIAIAGAALALFAFKNNFDSRI